MAKYSTATAEGFRDYQEARGRDVPATWDDDAIDASLLVASEWIDRVYRKSFIGERAAGFLQEREWPRINAVVYDRQYSHTYPSTEIPVEITSAVYELAYRDRAKPGSLLIDYTPGKYKSVRIDGAISVDYAQFSSASETQTTYPVIDQLLEILMDYRWSEYASVSGYVSRV